jgi:hypothetical protein
MNKRKTEAQIAFANMIAGRERFEMGFALEAAERAGAFDDFEEEVALKRDKKATVRAMIRRIQEADGTRYIRSYKSENGRVYINIPLTNDSTALNYFDTQISAIIDKNEKTLHYVRKRKSDIIDGQICLNEIADTATAKANDMTKID